MDSPIQRAFQVSGDQWNLLIKFGRPEKLSSRNQDDKRSSVSAASVDYVVSRDGSTWGKARYELEPRHGPFLALELPAQASIDWVSVDGIGVASLAREGGGWFVPLGDEDHRELIVAWHAPQATLVADSSKILEIPKLDRPAGQTVVRVDAPESVIPSMSGEGNVRVSNLASALAKIESLSQTITEALASFDRSSPVERESILTKLENIEILARKVARIQAASGLLPEVIPGQVAESFRRIDEAAQATGSEELISLARVRVGLDRLADRLEVGSAVTTPEVVRLRRMGTSHEFDCRGPGTIGLATAINSPNKPTEQFASRIFATLGSFAWLATGLFIMRGFRPEGRLAISLMGLSALGLLVAAPLPTLSALALLILGWFSDR
jgi:hypothetical protein